MSEEKKVKAEKSEKQDSSEKLEKILKESLSKDDVKEKETAKLKEENAKLQNEVGEFKDKWMRSVAEFDNYKKRNANLWKDAYNDGVSETVLKILPIGDGLDRALQMGLDDKTAEGIKGLKKKFVDTLNALGITEINPEGQPFDPNVAEAVMQAEKGDGDTSDTVKQVFEKGYKLNDKVIRYAKVSVIK